MTTISNTCQFIGRLGNEPTISTTQTGKKKAKFSLAASETYRNAEGKRVDNTTWVNIVAWDGLATIAEKYLHKGKQIALVGKLSTRNYEDKNGQKQFYTEIVASDILMLGEKESSH